LLVAETLKQFCAVVVQTFAFKKAKISSTFLVVLKNLSTLYVQELVLNVQELFFAITMDQKMDEVIMNSVGFKIVNTFASCQCQKYKRVVDYDNQRTIPQLTKILISTSLDKIPS
jgi:hypothetical protein